MASNMANGFKSTADFVVVENTRISNGYALLRLQAAAGARVDWEHIYAGQFVQVEVFSDSFALRRPISVHDVDKDARELSLLVRVAGAQTEKLCNSQIGSKLNLILPLGRGFDISTSGNRPLLVGGGVGTAPLLYLGKVLNNSEIRVAFLLAAKTSADLLRVDEFRKYGDVIVSTDDGSTGHKGFAAANPALYQEDWSKIYCCGPMPMMKSIARIANERNIDCEVSLENKMACGLGACLCCVEDTSDPGNVCVCTDGPVFNVKRLNWFK